MIRRMRVSTEEDDEFRAKGMGACLQMFLPYIPCYELVVFILRLLLYVLRLCALPLVSVSHGE